MSDRPALPGQMPNAFVPGQGNLSAEDQALVARRQAAMGPAYRLFYETPVHLVRGEGVWLYDAEGQAYLDTYNNVASVGHCHPRVVAAMAESNPGPRRWPESPQIGQPFVVLRVMIKR